MDGGVGVPILAQVSEWLREVGIPAQVLEDVSIATITSLNRYGRTHVCSIASDSLYPIHDAVRHYSSVC